MKEKSLTKTDLLEALEPIHTELGQMKTLMATMATKKDIARVEKSVDDLARITGKNFVRIEEKMATKEDMWELRSQMINKTDFKKQLSYL